MDSTLTSRLAAFKPTNTHFLSFAILLLSLLTAFGSLKSTFIGALSILILIPVKIYFDGGTCKITRDLTGKVAIVTGARSGVGKETTRALAAMGATVVMGCRSAKDAASVLEDIKKTTNSSKVEIMELDLADLDSVKKFAESFRAKHNRLDILINNAGIMALSERKLTKSGCELQFGTNHIGHFYLTTLLLDLIKKSAPSRVVNVSSRAQENGKIHWDDLTLKDSYSGFKAYGQSKLANVMFAKELQRRMDKEKLDVKATSVHPGAVKTELGRHMSENVVMRVLFWLFYPFYVLMTKSAMQGAQTSLYCALEDSEKLVGGGYYSDCKEKKPNPLALDEENGKRLWDVSEKIITENKK